MKPRNFPARKLQRQLDAKRDRAEPYTEAEQQALANARGIRTKKRRAK